MKYIVKVSFLALCTMLPTVSATKASLVADTCEYNTYMCCWTKNDNGVEDNADVCTVDGVDQPGDDEVHCHGMVWTEGASFESFILPLYKFVRTFDHRDARGYYGRIRGAEQCECIEKMPIVTRADCTTYSTQRLVACKDNDLRTHYEGEMESPGGKLPNLVGDCNNAEKTAGSGSRDDSTPAPVGSSGGSDDSMDDSLASSTTDTSGGKGGTRDSMQESGATEGTYDPMDESTSDDDSSTGTSSGGKGSSGGKTDDSSSEGTSPGGKGGSTSLRGQSSEADDY